jgi:cytidine deaminase
MEIKRVERVIAVEFFPFTELPSGEGRELIQRAIAARRNAQTPYSHFAVGAALWSKSGQAIYYGCNVECADYLGTHAEEAAITAMVVGGHKQIQMIAIAAAHEDEEFELSCSGLKMPQLDDLSIGDMMPACGNCLQKIWENCHGDKTVPILSIRPDGLVARATIGDMLPMAFDLSGVYGD